MMVVNSDEQEEAEASKVDLELPTLELNLSDSKEIDSVVQNIYSEDFPIRESYACLIENYGTINLNNQDKENIVDMKHEQDLNVESDEKRKVCEKEKNKFIDSFDVGEGMKCDLIKDDMEGNYEVKTDDDNIPKDDVKYKKEKLKSFKPSIQCQKCFKSVKRKTTFIRHMNAHAGIKPFECQHCSFKTVQNLKLTFHVKRKHPEKYVKYVAPPKKGNMRIQYQFMCEHCSKIFTRKKQMTDHKKRVHEKVETDTNSGNIMGSTKRYYCNQCKVRLVFYRWTDFKNHERFKHKLNGECNICGETLKTELEFGSHMKTHEKGSLMPINLDYPCQYTGCTMVYPNRGGLWRHKLLHTGERPFECDICHNTFRQKVAMEGHRRIHTGEKPFKCTACGKSFIQGSGLRSHKIQHKSMI